MASRAFVKFVIRYLIQFRYMKNRKRHNKEIHRHKKEKSFFITIRLQSDYNWVTNNCIISYILKTHSHSSSQKKKKKGRGKEAEDKGERQNEKEQEKEAKDKEKER